VNKFEGDAALCVFGAPTAHPDPAGSALATARSLSSRLRRDLHDVGAAIGVSAGRVVAGNVGAAERYEYTVIGDPVNEASRLVGVAKETPGRVVASAATLARAGAEERAAWDPDGEAQLRAQRPANDLPLCFGGDHVTRTSCRPRPIPTPRATTASWTPRRMRTWRWRTASCLWWSLVRCRPCRSRRRARSSTTRGKRECQGGAAKAVAERAHLVDDLGVHARRSKRARAADYTAPAARFRRASRRALTSRWNSSGKQGFMRYETAPTASAECLRYALKSCPVRMMTGMLAVSARV